jgi:hypothetical protein
MIELWAADASTRLRAATKCIFPSNIRFFMQESLGIKPGQPPQTSEYQPVLRDAACDILPT